MYILSQYQESVIKYPDLPNDEFLRQQIALLGNLFANEIMAIKDAKLEYVALSERYISEFDLTLGANLSEIKLQEDEAVSAKIRNQENLIVANAVYQQSLYLFKKNGVLTNYMTRKRPLVNPATGDVVGVLIVSAQFELGVFRKLYVKQLLTRSKPRADVSNLSLTAQQQQIIFCLLLGYHSRKEIAHILNNVTNENFNETRVKNGLKALYDKFECSTSGQLIDLISTNPIKMGFPADTMTEGNFLL